MIWRKKLDEYREISNYTYFEKQYDQFFLLDVHFFHKEHIVHATKACYKQIYCPHPRLVIINPIVGYADRTTHINFHYAHNL